ncbi:hypothetical protein C6P64_01470 [Malikia granosa]|uniref:LTD domain-containing protein n=1 Tax=Malikia granosa TaxID=263067 RepID=A0A2S9K8P0_9BURK|nr:hypothetical protein C6P64_01470 [Malikia granosa]
MALSAGSIAFVGFNADGTDGFACIVLDEIPAGQVIYFRDDEWNGTAFNTGEGISSWTNNTGAPIAVGTVVEFSAVSTAAPTASHGQLALVSGSQNLGASDETLYAYTSTGDATTGSFTFLSAVASGGYTAAMTLDGTGLTAGIDAIDFKPQDDDADVFAYNPASGGSSFVDAAAARLAIHTLSHWMSQDASGDQNADGVSPDAPFLIADQSPLKGVSFSIGAATPFPVVRVISLSLSSATGTEAGTTVITVTATAAAPVTGEQGVDLAVSGTGITADDYILSGSRITIADGATSGSITFTVRDDALVEGSETATLTLGNPSSGIALGSSSSLDLAIVDNEAVGALAYSGQLNEGLAFDGSVSGKILITLSGGETFAGSIGENLLAAVMPKAQLTNVPAGLTASLILTGSSQAELSFAGKATAHGNASDLGNLTLAFNNSAFAGSNASAITGSTQSGLAINFADLGTAGSQQTFTPNAGSSLDSSDASTAIALDANYMVVGDDEASVLRVYDRAGGPALVEWSYAATLANGGELDLEAGTRIGDTLYFVGSQSNTKSGNDSDPRENLFAVTVSGTGAQTAFTYLGKSGSLEAALSSWDSSNAHGQGANYFGFAASSAAGVVPEGVNGFSIEGLSASQDSNQLLLAFRAPQTDTVTRQKALIVPVAVSGLIGGSPSFGAPVELDLGGRGIRSIEKAADGNGYLLLAGPAGSASAEVTHDFRIYRVSTDLTRVTELDVNLDALRDAMGGSFEAIVDVQGTVAGTLVQLLQDNGDTVWPGKTGASKDLPAAEQQFVGNWVELGSDVADATGPRLVSSSPADNAVNVGVSSKLVLKFDEGVKAGSGSFVIRKTSDSSVVDTIQASSSRVAIAFNTVTIEAGNLANATGYYLEATADALSDHAGNAWVGISGVDALNFATVSAAPRYDLLITEVNSNAAGGDFFELYNHGTTPIDLTGWKWDDDSANPADPAAVSLSGMLNPGARLVVVAAADAAAFRSAWGLADQVPVLATGGPGLGNGDAVVVFDRNGYVAAGVNFKATPITATDGTVITPMVRSDGLALTTAHAGLAVGGSATESAVWDGVSTSAPQYNDADVGVLGAFAQGAAAASIGSPGNVLAGAGLATPYTESFGTSLGEFTAYSSDGDKAATWYRASSGTAEVNGFGDTAHANDWLISKPFDLSQTSVEYLSFTTWTRYSDAGIANPEVKLKYSTDYPGSGDPALYTWTELSYSPSPDNSQATTASGLIDLSAIQGSHVHFAFHYTASGAGSNSSSSWRVDDVKIEGYAGAVLSLAATNASQAEGQGGSSAFTFTVTRAGDISGTTTVDYAVGGAAVDAADFGGQLPSGTVSFAAGETSKTITLNVAGDSTAESNEAFTLILANAVGGQIIAATASGTILDDDAAPTLISAIQGSGSASAMLGQTVTIQGVVTAYMPSMKGFFVQEEAADSDGNVRTSEGIFVYYNNSNPGIAVTQVGDVVRLTGTVAEYQGQTQLTAPSNLQLVTDHVDSSALPAPVRITLPVADMVDWESVEGMLVEVSSATAGGKLVVTDNYTLGQYGTVTLTSDTLLQQYTETNAPSVSGYAAYMAATQKDQVILDDGSSSQNLGIHPGRGGNDLSAGNTLRAGDSVTSVVGVVDQLTVSGALAYETSYRIQPTIEPLFTGSARPAAADLPAAITGAEIKVASVNVLNYFTTLGSSNFTNPNGTSHQGRGASNAAEFIRQQDKIVANLLGLDADVLGLMEMQNNGFADGSAIDSLVDALNAKAGAGTYAYIAGPFNDGAGSAGDAATAGDDAIMVAILYKPAKVTPVGQAAVADPALYDAFSASLGSRVPVAQTFQAVADGEQFTVVVNHFKSKGSVNDPDIGDGQGANNQARLEAARDLLSWLGTNPTGSTDSDLLLLGDFNAYSQEDPITYLDANGYNKVSSGLSYSFDGLWGSLDHALASDSLSRQVSGAVKWAINAEEPALLDYNTEFKNDAQDASYYAPDAYRSSDHNPILIGLNLASVSGPVKRPTPNTPFNDFNGDGKSDLRWVKDSGEVSLWLMDGTTPTAKANFGSFDGWSIKDSRQDFNGDGKTDLLWTNLNGAASVWTMDALNATSIANHGSYAGWQLVDGAGDYNGDGKADLRWVQQNGEVSLWLMDGAAPSAKANFGSFEGWSVKDGSRDFNGDGKTDLLWTNANGAASVWTMDGLNATSIANHGPYTGWQLVDGAGDYNGDGKADLRWVQQNGEVSLWLMDGTTPTAKANFGSFEGWSVKDGSQDFNGDGKTDLLWTKANGAVSVWIMDGLNATSIANHASYAGWQLVDGAGDYNGDGKADLRWVKDNGEISLWLMDGVSALAKANFDPAVGLSVKDGSRDFNGDGKTDLLWTDASGAESVWLMDGVSLVGTVNPGDLAGWTLI